MPAVAAATYDVAVPSPYTLTHHAAHAAAVPKYTAFSAASENTRFISKGSAAVLGTLGG